MTIFNEQMSYAELSAFLYSVRMQKRLLSKTELSCIEGSLRDPFLKKMLMVYPLSSASQSLVRSSVGSDRARMVKEKIQPLHSSAFHPIYGGLMEKTALYLTRHYPPLNGDMMIMLQIFIKNIIQHEYYQNQLISWEQNRYAVRQAAHAVGFLEKLEPLQSIEQINEDFLKYAKHLQLECTGDDVSKVGAKELRSILVSLLTRGILLQQKGQSNEASYANYSLIAALDEARTIYHDKPYSYYSDKIYSCNKCLEACLLDYHSGIAPIEQLAQTADITEQTIFHLQKLQ